MKANARENISPEHPWRLDLAYSLTGFRNHAFILIFHTYLTLIKPHNISDIQSKLTNLKGWMARRIDVLGGELSKSTRQLVFDEDKRAQSRLLASLPGIGNNASLGKASIGTAFCVV